MQKPMYALRRIYKWLVAVSVVVLVTGGLLAVGFEHFLKWATGPEVQLFTDVAIVDPRPATAYSTVTALTHEVILRNEGDIAVQDLHFQIKFSPTEGSPTIRGPTISAYPDSILEITTVSSSRFDTYKIKVDEFAPGSEISLFFASDQVLKATLDVRAKGIQFERSVEPKFHTDTE